MNNSTPSVRAQQPLSAPDTRPPQLSAEEAKRLIDAYLASNAVYHQCYAESRKPTSPERLVIAESDIAWKIIQAYLPRHLRDEEVEP